MCGLTHYENNISLVYLLLVYNQKVALSRAHSSRALNLTIKPSCDVVKLIFLLSERKHFYALPESSGGSMDFKMLRNPKRSTDDRVESKQVVSSARLIALLLVVFCYNFDTII